MHYLFTTDKFISTSSCNYTDLGERDPTRQAAYIQAEMHRDRINRNQLANTPTLWGNFIQLITSMPKVD